MLEWRRNILIGCYVLFTVIAPWATMFAVYGWSTGWSLMGFYSHLFWFPLLFGIVQVLFLTRLLQTFDLSGRKLFRRVALPFSIATVIAGGFIEITERPALFELKPTLIKQTISGTNNRTFLDHLQRPQTDDRVASKLMADPRVEPLGDRICLRLFNSSADLHLDVDGLRILLDCACYGVGRL